MKNSKIGAATTALALCASMVAACGPDSNADGNGASQLPGGKSTLVVGTSVGAPPYEFYDEGSTSEVLGYEPDLLKAAGDLLGVDVEFQVADYTALFGALDAKRYDFVAFGLVDRQSRQEQYDVLDYAKDASGFLGKMGTTGELSSMSDVCGKTVAVQSGASVEATLIEESKRCEEGGNPAIDLLTSKDLPAIALAVTSGRADYASSQVPLLAYNASQLEGLEVSKLTYLDGFVGFVLPKDSELTEPLGDAIDTLMENGTYDEIMEKWGLGDLSLDSTSVNAGSVE